MAADIFQQFMNFTYDEFYKASNVFFGVNHQQKPIIRPPVAIQLAGISGGIAVAFAAYGAHFVNDNPDLSAERKRSMQYANQHHFLNTIGMILAALASRRPKLTATLFAFGTILFCGPSYAYAIKSDRTFRNLTPIGGVVSMLAWFSFLL